MFNTLNTIKEVKNRRDMAENSIAICLMGILSRIMLYINKGFNKHGLQKRIQMCTFQMQSRFQDTNRLKVKG